MMLCRSTSSSLTHSLTHTQGDRRCPTHWVVILIAMAWILSMVLARNVLLDDKGRERRGGSSALIAASWVLLTLGSIPSILHQFSGAP
ncbi:hypothetical protein BDQ94DRAFT_136685 [Aspergillus welwitschiae]|uniref:Uncharacterized protein n=1 Tax=Aspergillus welwitschiae TaxID=1341132 RepID=A0A3F3QE72_9EURO|nr:hypothetical protein BDQ94DRAFT_136685 [Aspergillus welwitschiae]RDH37584.1 hypothetical protein BDQ94DRAFT_136685 [Aspergillus welwitschiae]